MAEPRTITGGVDSWVGQQDPSANHNGADYLYVNNGGSGNQAYGMLFIKAPAPVDSGAAVLDASLTLRFKYASAGTITFKVVPVVESWKANKVTWANKPPTSGGGVTTTVSDVSQGDTITFDVGAQLQAVADGDDWYGWRVECETAGKNATFFSTQAQKEQHRPALTTEWSNAPVAPTDLAPSGGRFVSTDSPVLRYTYADFGGNTDLDGQQIQVESLDEFGEPTHVVLLDTGWIDTVDPEYDLSEDVAWTALTNGAACRWRARVRDGAGLESDWSDWAAFERLIKGSLVIDNPAADPNDYVQDVTPPIMWTMTSAWGQSAWQVIIQQQATGIDGTWIEVYDSGKRSGNDDSWTLPKGVLTRANWTDDPGGGNWQVQTRYRVVVRTWDGQVREHTPGDPVYYQAEREFTVREGATPGVTGLTVSADYPYPGAVLNFSRATAPDAWVLVRGGDVIDKIPAEDAFVSGTSYRMYDKRARPNVEHAWAVLPVVNGVMATAEAATVTATVQTVGIWITNPDRDNDSAVLILGSGDYGTFDAVMEDQGENFDIIGSSRVLRITNALKGYAGSISGVMTTHPGLPNISARDWSNRMMEFKSEPGMRLILTLSDMALPVVLYDITTRPTPDLDVIEFEASFFEDQVPRFVER